MAIDPLPQKETPPPAGRDVAINKLITRYGVDATKASIMVERQKVYGEPKQNHEFIAMTIAGILQPYAVMIAKGTPLPPHVIALIMSGLKFCRERVVYHPDNFDDLANYQAFAKVWHKEWSEENPEFKPFVLPEKPKPGAQLTFGWL